MSLPRIEDSDLARPGEMTDLAGLGTDSIRWIGVQQTMDMYELDAVYRRDIKAGYRPFLVVGSAGTAPGANQALRRVHLKELPAARHAWLTG